MKSVNRRQVLYKNVRKASYTEVGRMCFFDNLNRSISQIVQAPFLVADYIFCFFFYLKQLDVTREKNNLDERLFELI